MTADENRPTAYRGSEQDVLEDALLDRINRAIAEIKSALDAAVGQPTARNLDQLREATDRLMRASARVLIDIGPRADRITIHKSERESR